MCHLSQENRAHECEGKNCWILIDGLDLYKCKAEKVINVTIIRLDMNYQNHDKKVL